jgi:glycosyltransferase involved in cell wall biosynthesis
MPNRLSIIATSVTGLPAIAECVSSLVRQTRGSDHEIIVAVRLADGAGDRLRRFRAEFPEVTVVEGSGRQGIPHLRALGLEHASGDVVAFIGEHYLPDDSWVERVVAGFESDLDGFGGPVEMMCPRTTTNWAVYLCEYSSLMLPVPRGEGGVPGNNCAYRRSVFDASGIETLRTSWEFFLQQDLKSQGRRIHFEPTMVVSLKRNYSIRRFLSIRFDFSRSFAGMRRERIGSKAFVYALLAPALAPLMYRRIAEPVFRKRRYRREFLLASPLIALFCVAAAFGEAAGYLFGAGECLGDVE